MTKITSTKFEFHSTSDNLLAGRLELPPGRPSAFAIFAHCFTCGKNAKAATSISRQLASLGIGVLRFDFTGLGNSEGDFANSNFASNVQDLIDASQALAQQHTAPQLLIGHSLGGTAALIAASRLPSIRAVATIGSPATPGHVTGLFAESLNEINSDGSTDIDLAGRRFTISKQFVDDVNSPAWRQDLKQVQSAVLICHSPADTVVPIDQATQLYKTINHPKSFVSLDGADHLLVDKSDSQYVGKMITAWASRYLDLEEAEPASDRHSGSSSGSDFPPPLAEGELLVHEQTGFTNRITTLRHQVLADEPISVGGEDLGMNPYEFLLAAIGACTSMTLRMYARHKGLSLTGIAVKLKHHRIHAKDCDECESDSGKISVIEKLIHVTGDLSPDQVKRLGEIADRCPVHRTIMQEKRVESTIELKQ